MQSYYDAEKTRAETAIVTAKTNISSAQSALAIAQQQAADAAEEARKYNDTASILAARAEIGRAHV